MATKIFGVGVIGCGGISAVHTQCLSNMENIVIKAVCDIKPERAKKYADSYNCEVFTDYKELLKLDTIDVVHICTPHYLHAPMTLAALAAGKYVLCEKPMATTLADARQMIATAKGRLGIIFQNRYNESTKHAKSIIDSGELGKVIGVRANVCWHRTAPYYLDSGWRGSLVTEGGGSLINQAIHTVDLMQYLGGRVAAVKGSVTTDLLKGTIEVEENAHAVFQYVAGHTGILYTTNSHITDAPIELEITLEHGVLLLKGDSLTVTHNGVDTQFEQTQHAVIGKSYWGSSHALQIADFYRSIENNEPFFIDGLEGYPAFNIVKAIYESSSTNAWIQLDDPSTF